MLSPSRVKYRKVHKGRMKGRAKAGDLVSFTYLSDPTEIITRPRTSSLCPVEEL